MARAMTDIARVADMYRTVEGSAASSRAGLLGQAPRVRTRSVDPIREPAGSSTGIPPRVNTVTAASGMETHSKASIRMADSMEDLPRVSTSRAV